MDYDNIGHIVAAIRLVKRLSIHVQKGEAPKNNGAYWPSEITVKLEGPGRYYSEFAHLHAPIFERHGAQMQAEFEAACQAAIAQLEAELKGEICPQPEPRPDDHLDPVRDAFGPSNGLNADWACDAWRIATNHDGEIWLLDDEHPQETVSIVLRKDDGSDDPTLSLIAQGTVDQILPIAVGIREASR